MNDDVSRYDLERAEAVHEYGSGEAREVVGFEDEVEALAGRMDDEIILSIGVHQGNEEISNTAWLTNEQARELADDLLRYAEERESE